MNIRLATALASVALLGCVAQASAFTLDFSNVQYPGYGLPIQVSGGGGETATFSAPGSQFEAFPNNGGTPFPVGTTHLTAGGGAIPITIDFSEALSSITLPIFAYAIDPVTTTVDFYNGTQLLGSVSNQESSTLTEVPLFSFTGTITSVVISEPDSSASFPLGAQINPITYTLSAVPLPASAPLFGTALLALGAIGYGLKRKPKATA